MWLPRSHTAPLQEGTQCRLELLEDVTQTAAFPLTAQPSLCHIQTLEATGIHYLHYLLPLVTVASQRGAWGGGELPVRIPRSTQQQPPSTTVCLLPPQEGALLSNLPTSGQAPHLCPHPPIHTHLPTHCPPHTHMCTMRARRRAPDLQAPDGRLNQAGG